jgi:pantoate--beta-alanine ligase
MKIVRSATALRPLRAPWKSVGFVPTMGALHPAHMSLVARAKRECQRVIVSVFVNPTQFAPHEDFSKYPRPFKQDAALCRQAGVDVLYHPSPTAMYPQGFQSTIEVPRVAAPLEGRFRPGHFSGVATVVLKLLNQVTPHRLYLGEKDFQQLAVIRRMVTDLDLDVRVVGCKTIREADGLALSSRNAYLSPAQRARAPFLQQALRHGAIAARKPRATPATVRAAMRQAIRPMQGRLDYLEIVEADTLVRPKRLRGRLRLLGAVHLGNTRLIDNIPLFL